jgi:hypothetical protein
MIGDDPALSVIDEQMQGALKLAAEGSSKCIMVARTIRAAHDHFMDHLLMPLSRAYWAQAPQRTPPGRDADVATRLQKLDGDLAASYEQVVEDLEDEDRWSYRGPAGELREVLTGALQRLAPTASVQATEWYKDARRSGGRTDTGPTRAERVRFILRARVAGDTATETAEAYMVSVEERLAVVVNATYYRGSAATHGGTERTEVVQILQYINALLKEVLPPAS